MFRKGDDCCDSCNTCQTTHHKVAACDSGCDSGCRETLRDRLRRWFKKGDDCCDSCNTCDSCNGHGGVITNGAPVYGTTPAARPAEKIAPPKAMPKGDEKKGEGAALDGLDRQAQSIVPQPIAPILATPAETKSPF
jgi:hypothetical protein